MKTAFVDTNILIYAAGGAEVDARKKQIARKITLLSHLRISVQVLNEFIAVARNPKKLNLSRKEESHWLSEWYEFKISPLTFQTFHKALELHLRYEFSHWESLVIAAALEEKCHVLYSEDLQHGQVIEGMEIINPFRES